MEKSKNKFEDLYENSPSMHISVNIKTNLITECNQTLCNNLGFEKEEILGKSVFTLYDPDSVPAVKAASQVLRNTGAPVDLEVKVRRKNGTEMYIGLHSTAVKDGKGRIRESRSTWSDISRRKNSRRNLDREAVRTKLLLELYVEAPSLNDRQLYDYALNKAVELTESKIGFFHQVAEDQNTVILTTWNKEAMKDCMIPSDDHYPIEQAGNWVDCIRQKRPIIYNDFVHSPHQKGLPPGHTPLERFMSIPVIAEGKILFIFGVGNKPSHYDDHDSEQIQLVANELYKIIMRRRTEAALEESEKKYRALFENMNEGFCLNEIIVDEKGEPVDYRFLEINKAFERITGRHKGEIIGKTMREVLPGIEKDPSNWIGQFGDVALTGKNLIMEDFLALLDRWYLIHVFSPKENYFAATFVDITDRKRVEEELKGYHEHLEELVRERTIKLENEIADRKKIEGQIRTQMDDLERFRKLAVGRELRMMALKREVNELLQELSGRTKYRITD